MINGQGKKKYSGWSIVGQKYTGLQPA